MQDTILKKMDEMTGLIRKELTTAVGNLEVSFKEMRAENIQLRIEVDELKRVTDRNEQLIK